MSLLVVRVGRSWKGDERPEADIGDRSTFGAGKVRSDPSIDSGTGPGWGAEKVRSLASMWRDTGGEIGRLLVVDGFGESERGVYDSASMYDAMVPEAETISMSSMSTDAEVMLGEGCSMSVVCEGAGEAMREIAADEGAEDAGAGLESVGVERASSANGFSMTRGFLSLIEAEISDRGLLSSSSLSIEMSGGWTDAAGAVEGGGVSSSAGTGLRL